MKVKIDVSEIIDGARQVDLEGVFNGQRKSVSGVSRVQRRWVPVGARGRSMTVLCEFRKLGKGRKP